MLKLTAMILMLIDHATLVFIPPSSSLYFIGRLLGRLAMPIFAYKIAVGFIYTSNFKNYLRRIGLMTLWAQIPFIWMIYDFSFVDLLDLSNFSSFFSTWNIGLTFMCALLILKLYEDLNNAKAKSPALNMVAIALLGMLSTTSDYGIYGIFIVIIFYIFINYNHDYFLCLVLLVGSTVLYYLKAISVGTFVPLLLQLPCVLSLLLIRYIPDNKLPLSSKTWYNFYPAHMLILAILNSLFT